MLGLPVLDQALAAETEAIGAVAGHGLLLRGALALELLLRRPKPGSPPIPGGELLGQLVALPEGSGAEEVAEALKQSITTLPAQLRRSLIWDQGSEMAEHRRFSLEAGLPVYFCDPRSPWQRGSNENTNGLLRQYFPKGKSLAGVSQERLDEVAGS